MIHASLLLKKHILKILTYVYGYFACMYVCVPHVYSVPLEGRGQYWIPLEVDSV